MRLVVGLGNPGPKYHGTRHNVGFAVADELAARAGLAFAAAPVDALIARWRARDTLLAKPMTFMNTSGAAVGDLLRYFKIDAADLLVIVDEVQLPLGRLRFGRSGSAGGHNGLKSIVQFLGPEFSRLRIGVGRGDPQWDLADHVLSRFLDEESEMVERAVTRAADGAEAFVDSGIEIAMNRFNAPGDEPEPKQSKTEN